MPKEERQLNVEFSKDIHEYLTHYVDVADAKAAVLIGLASGMVGFIYSSESIKCINFLFLLVFIMEFLSIGAALYAVFPRLYSGGDGFIFWKDILTRKSPEAYILAVHSLCEKDIESDYSKQNYFLSKILNKKYSAIKWSILAFTLGAVFVALSTLISIL